MPPFGEHETDDHVSAFGVALLIDDRRDAVALPRGWFTAGSIVDGFYAKELVGLGHRYTRRVAGGFRKAAAITKACGSLEL